MVGLSTAWFLQQRGVHVTLYERRHVAAGSSWGNAGWLTPALTAPLPEPAFDELAEASVELVTTPADPFLACFRTAEERSALVTELQGIEDAGQPVKYTLLSGEEVRSAEPTLSPAIGAAVQLHD
jgi:D-amino-acid dehydrogenase